jgi:hypothetical protein
MKVNEKELANSLIKILKSPETYLDGYLKILEAITDSQFTLLKRTAEEVIKQQEDYGVEPLVGRQVLIDNGIVVIKSIMSYGINKLKNKNYYFKK